jgi:phosphoribosylformimino-5-aminoimidazole carboxamide ribotide isomerase
MSPADFKNSDFDIFPAIDLLDGRSVRLLRGQRESAHVVHANPVEQMREYAAAGARWVHIVNLNAAFGDSPEIHSGAAETEKLIGMLAASGGLKIQLGGGIRSAGSLGRALSLGVSRVVIGTWAMTDFENVMEFVRREPERFVIGVDSLGGSIAIRGWTQTCPETTLAFAGRLKKAGVRTVLFTEVERDGMLQGAALEATATLAAESGLSVIASGGVAGIDDIRALSECSGVCGVVTGKALAAGRLSLIEALSYQRS